MKYIFTIVFLFFSIFSFAQNKWSNAYSELFGIDTANNEVEYLHFKIRTIPEYHYYSIPYLTDIYYSIEYKEYGTPEKFKWVDLYDGHLINDIDKKYSTQWQGPFIGNRQISYKFMFELIKDNHKENKLKLTIFSTNPELDFKYCNIYPNFPFKVNAFYYNTDNLEEVIDIYSGASTIYTVYSIAKSSNIAVTIGTAILENIIIYAIKSHISNMPIYLSIRCNVCGQEERIVINNLNYNKLYTCKTDGCHNSAKIIMTN